MKRRWKSSADADADAEAEAEAEEQQKKEKERAILLPRAKKAKVKVKVKVKGDPRRPKKPPTAFFYYLQDFRSTFRQQNPAIKTMSQIGKACAHKWKTLPFQEKVAYYDIATEKRAEFESVMAEYIKRKENGELTDESEDEL